MSSEPRARWASIAWLVPLVALAACATVNDPLAVVDPLAASASEYRFPDVARGENTHSLFICLTFSGGGTRAAALSYGVLEKLRATEIEWKGEKKTLLDEVDCISSVSGGSFTAAYYGLFADRVFSDYRTAFLEKNIEGALFWRLFNPINWFRLASPYFNRIDLAAEYYDEHLYGHRTFASLTESDGPFVMLNATNLANGYPFTFTQEQFEFLGSQLSTYPVARAVAASSAFPFLLSPITLENHPNPPDFELPTRFRSALSNPVDDRRRYDWARSRTMYATDKKHLRYVHLMDGGLADNIGIRAVDSELRRGFIRRAINNDEVEKLVILIVNARTESKDEISERRKPPGILYVAGATASVAMDNLSAESIEVLRDTSRARQQIQATISACRTRLDACGAEPMAPLASGHLAPYVIDVSFDSLPDAERRRYFLDLPTSFHLSKEEVDNLISVGPELLEGSEDFQDLMQDLESGGRP